MGNTELKIEAVYENGVFVPTRQPPLAEHERVRLIVESGSGIVPSQSDGILRRRERRIRLDPALAREIASAPEFHPDGV